MSTKSGLNFNFEDSFGKTQEFNAAKDLDLSPSVSLKNMRPPLKRKDSQKSNLELNNNSSISQTPSKKETNSQFTGLNIKEEPSPTKPPRLNVRKSNADNAFQNSAGLSIIDDDHKESIINVKIKDNELPNYLKASPPKISIEPHVSI